jgi:mono/diheme cytochrome c family protein
MLFRVVPVAVAFVSIGMISAPASSMGLGEFEYMNSCAQCHGADAKGAGPMAELLTKTPPDLTVLAKNNGGVFPVSTTYAVIDGTSEIGSHGREMPIWGSRYSARASQIGDNTADFPFDPTKDSDRYVRTRILSIIDYLSTLQQD